MIDLMLDSWHAPSSTKPLEALSNGLPVLSLSDTARHSRRDSQVRSFLEASGQQELVATSLDYFVPRAVELVVYPVRLGAMRARVQPSFDGSGCCDSAALARWLETAFVQMFDLLWSGQQAAVGAP